MKVPCTGCRYCVPCPKGISIPDIFEQYNTASMRGLLDDSGKIFLQDYNNLVKDNRGANQCINCGACAKQCPQHIDIPSKIQEAHVALIG